VRTHIRKMGEIAPVFLDVPEPLKRLVKIIKNDDDDIFTRGDVY